MKKGFSERSIFWGVVVVSAILLSIATVYAQVDDVTEHFIKNGQEKVHLQMMGGMAGNPWQYRILGDWMVDYIIRLFFDLNVPSPKITSYIIFRFLQCFLIFISAGVFYRKLGLSLYANLIGLSVLAWSMSHSLYNSDLSLNVFFDIVFYLMAAIAILNRKYFWVPLLMVPAAFNRETSALIPVMLIAFAYVEGRDFKRIRPALLYALLAIVLFVIIFAGLRIYYGEQQFLTADGYYPGVGLLILNLSRWVTWEQLLITLSLIPFMAVFAFNAWPRSLKTFFWVIVPIWVGVHFFAALVAESRLFLVPQALIFIPGMLFGLTNKARYSAQAGM